MNTHRNKYCLEVWIGMAKVHSNDKQILNGANEAYVQVVGLANSKRMFRDKISNALNKIGLKLTRIETVEPFNERIQKNKVDPSLYKSADDILLNVQNMEIGFGTFHTYSKP